MQKSLEKQTGLTVQADGTVVDLSAVPDSSAFAPGKRIRSRGACADGLVPYDEVGAARRGEERLSEAVMPHPASYDSDGRRCVAPQSIARSKSKSSSAQTLTGVYGLVTACAKLAARAQALAKADLSCADVSGMYNSKEDREAFCGTLVTEDGQRRCQMSGQDCVSSNVETFRQLAGSASANPRAAPPPRAAPVVESPSDIVPLA